MPYLHTGSRPETTARIYVRPAAPADETTVIDPPRPARYRGKHRAGTPRYATVVGALVLFATVVAVGLDAMLGMVGR